MKLLRKIFLVLLAAGMGFFSVFRLLYSSGNSAFLSAFSFPLPGGDAAGTVSGILTLAVPVFCLAAVFLDEVFPAATLITSAIGLAAGLLTFVLTAGFTEWKLLLFAFLLLLALFAVFLGIFRQNARNRTAPVPVGMALICLLLFLVSVFGGVDLSPFVVVQELSFGKFGGHFSIFTAVLHLFCYDLFLLFYTGAALWMPERTKK